MAKNKTTETESSVTDFIDAVAEETKRKNSFEIMEIMKEATGLPAKMWGSAIVGFGSYHYTYESGREGDAPLVGFSPRKDAISLYLSNFEEREALLAKFGKHKTGKACVYIKNLANVDVAVFKEMIEKSVAYVRGQYPSS